MWKPLETWAGRRKQRAVPVSALAYVSTADAALSAGQVMAMGTNAQFRNNGDGITGILVYNGRNFFQIVEGDRDPLYALLGRLHLDTRHSGISLVYEQAQTQRAFGNWDLRIWQANTLRDVAGELPRRLDPQLANLARSFAQLR